MKKVLFIVPSKAIGGTNSSLSSLINYLNSKCNIDVLLMSSSGNGQYGFLQSALYDGVLDAYYTNYSLLSGKNKFYSVLLKIIKRIALLMHLPYEDYLLGHVAKRYQKYYDIVVGFSEGKAMKLASHFSSPIKYTWIHCEYDRAVGENVSELTYYKKFDKIICVSKYTRDRFINRYPSLNMATIYIYNLLDIERVMSLSNALIDDARFTNDKFTILSVGRMDPVKRFSYIPQIAKELVNGRLNFVWYIIGGPENSEYIKIKSEIEKYGLIDNVILLGSKLNPYPYFKQSSLYVSTSLSEACPMVFNEAKLLGLHIVSADFGSSYEFVDVGTGYIRPIESIAEVIKKIYTDRLPHWGAMKSDDSVMKMDKFAKHQLDELFI